MTPYPHQVEVSIEAAQKLVFYGIAYLAMEERTGKTLAAVMTAEDFTPINNVLVLTKKNALPGWEDTLGKYVHSKNYTVTNYHQADKLKGKFDLVILDESHNYISGYPKPSNLHREISRLTKGVPIIYCSATPYAQGPQLLYHQFSVSSYSPWKGYKNFYKWFKDYGIPSSIRVKGIEVHQYNQCKVDKVLTDCKHLFITKTRTELGFEHEPEDKLHYIDLAENTRFMYNTLLKHKLYTLANDSVVLCESVTKLRTSLHQIEGGTIISEDGPSVLANTEKIDYIKANFSDSPKLVIMYNYRMEKVKLQERFKEATILQATSNAEGVDLHLYDDLVIYSQDFSTARHSQRRARQANKNRSKPIKVHFLLVKKGLSEQVYTTVSRNKRNFIDSMFREDYLL